MLLKQTTLLLFKAYGQLSNPFTVDSYNYNASKKTKKENPSLLCLPKTSLLPTQLSKINKRRKETKAVVDCQQWHPMHSQLCCHVPEPGGPSNSGT